jgi:hypothetical protein
MSANLDSIVGSFCRPHVLVWDVGMPNVSVGLMNFDGLGRIPPLVLGGGEVMRRVI